MKLAALTYKIAPTDEAWVGKGSHSIVYKAIEEASGRRVAIKKSRVSRTVPRPTLLHESRLLQLLKGHAAIPAMYGYGQLAHFEYMALELLGPNIAEQQKDGAGVMVKTVIRVLDQILAALEHIHSLGIVHRDIKPENILCDLNDPSTVKIIDFGISKPFSCGQPSKYDPLKEPRQIVGSLYWASLNSHNGVDLSLRDDLESVALITLFLLRGDLPWKPRPRLESQLRSQEIVRLMKLGCSGPILSTDFPAEFGDLLTYSRSLNFDQPPDYVAVRRRFASLAEKMGYSLNGPLDWTPCYHKTVNHIPRDPEVTIPDEDGGESDCDSEIDLGKDSYCGWDLDVWHRHGNRDKDVTLPVGQETALDAVTPLIVEVLDD